MSNSKRVDYLIVGENNGGYEFIFVELEAPYGNITLKNGELGETFRKGISQLNDWDSWLEANFHMLKETFNKSIAKGKSLPTEFLELDKSRIHYVVVAGRYTDFNERTFRIKRRKKNQRILILNYDDLYKFSSKIIQFDKESFNQKLRQDKKTIEFFKENFKEFWNIIVVINDTGILMMEEKWEKQLKESTKKLKKLEFKIDNLQNTYYLLLSKIEKLIYFIDEHFYFSAIQEKLDVKYFEPNLHPNKFGNDHLSDYESYEKFKDQYHNIVKKIRKDIINFLSQLEEKELK